MGVKQLDFRDFSLDPKLGIKDYSVIHFKNGIPLKFFLLNKDIKTDIKSGRTPSKFNEYYWNGEYEFLTMQDVDTATFEVNETSEKITDYAIEDDKTLYQAPEGALIVSNAMTVGQAFITKKNIYINQNVFHLEIDESKLNKTFIKWYFNLIFRPNFERVFVSKYFSKNEYSRLKIPNIEIEKQNLIADKILIIEEEIRKLKSQFKEPLEVINEVFAEFYGYSKTLWLEFGKGMTAGTQKSNIKTLKWYNVLQTDISYSNILRFSTRFHNPLTHKLTDILLSKPTLKISDILTQDIRRGVQPKKDENGDYYVIKTGQLKNGYIDISEADMVTTEFFEAKTKAQVQKGDILLASTGKVSLGKVDVYEFEEEAVVDGHVSIIRINKEKYNEWFLVYFLRSILGTFQIERDYTGATNQIELYPEQISQFQIPDLNLEQQQNIIKQIKSQLDQQIQIEHKIENYREQIKQIIEDAINNI
ncbi:MAG: type restriction enzyme subunit [Candidatus Petromonas sp.]|jgi:type I restriction enzyme S subunit|nr:type restriction enzyme subunit [Candidatus Petromonas sp.]